MTKYFSDYQKALLREHLGRCSPLPAGKATERLERWLDQPHTHCITSGHDQYPAALRALHDAPLVLYGLGSWQVFDKPAVALVGARRCTERAAAHTFRLAREIASHGWCVVSGLARGVDAAAHRGALASGVPASTIAVLGTGIDLTYPPENAPLASQIVASGGLLLTEFALGTPPLARHFPQRNRIVAALARATIVMQATRRSGSMITARLAADFGREVLAVPGAPGDALSEGPNELIRQGAALLEHAGDLWGAFGLCDQMRETPCSIQKCHLQEVFWF